MLGRRWETSHRLLKSAAESASTSMGPNGLIISSSNFYQTGRKEPRSSFIRLQGRVENEPIQERKEGIS